MRTSDRNIADHSWLVTRLDLVRYAGASLDFNPIHIDDEAARGAGYDAVIAHGMSTMGQALVHVADAVSPTAVGACSGRFAAPALAGSSLSPRVVEETTSSVRLSVDDADGVQVLDLSVDLVPPPDPEPLEGAVLADRVLVVERGPATRFAEAVGATGAHYFDQTAAERAGFASVPVVPTLPFALPGWGWFPDRQVTDGGEPPDAVRDCQAWTGSSGAVIHAGQDFAYHRPLLVGDVVRSTAHRVQHFTKQGRSGALHFTVVEQRFANLDDRPVVTSTMTLLVRELA